MKEKTNKVHVHGFINRVIANEMPEGKKSFFIDVATMEAYQKKQAEGTSKEYERKYTFHTVNVITDDKKTIKALEGIAADLQANKDNMDVKDYKPKKHEASFDGSLVTRANEDKEKGVTYYNTLIMSSVDEMKLDAKLEKDEVRNMAYFKGNIADVNIKDGFATLSIATHYYAPGESTNYKGEEKGYTEKTTYVNTRISGNFLSEEFEALKNGDIAKGDLITVKGRMHNNRYTDKDGVNRSAIVVDIRDINLVAKKGEKQAEAEKQEKKQEEKPKKTAVKKATPKKKTQVKMS